MFDHPHTPQSPSTLCSANLPLKPTSPQINNSLPTPAHSINGSMSSMSSDMVSEQLHLEESSHKRKRELEDHGDQEQKKVHIEDSRFGIDDLHIDVGEKYLLCKTPHPVVRPHPGQDLFAMYGLAPIAASVARHFPDGKKNTLRKSYKGKIKESGISGNFDAVKKELEAPDTLFAMMMHPQEEWEMQFVRGKEVEKGIPEPARAALGRAMTMSRGDLSKDDWDSKVLGELGAAPIAKKVLDSGVKTAALQNPAIVRMSKAEGPRPKRNIRKRTYGDASFEGYGEGYVDDEQDAQDGGYSTGDGDERGAGQKRKKKTSSTSSQQGNSRNGGSGSGSGYGPGMIGA